MPEQGDRRSHRYESAGAALTSVGEWFDRWTISLTERATELSYALIAANWAVFGSVDKIINSPWSKLSLISVVVLQAANLVLTRVIAGALRSQYAHAEADPSRWQEEFERAKTGCSAWPSTNQIDGSAALLRELKTWLPLAGGVFFCVALFRP